MAFGSRRRRTFAATITVLSLLGAACGGGDDEETAAEPVDGAEQSSEEARTEPYTFYAIVDETGPAAPGHAPARDAIQTYFDQVNEDGGIHGAEVEVVVLDSQSTPDAAQAAFREATAAEPDGMAGFLFSGGWIASLDLITASGAPTFANGATDAMLFPPTPNLYMLGASGRSLVTSAVLQLESLLGGLEGKKIAWAALQTPNVEAYVPIFHELAEEKGFEITDEEWFQLQTPSFSAQADKITQGSPDGVLVIATGVDAPTVANAMSDAGLEVPMVVGSAAGADAPAVFEAIDNPNYWAIRILNHPRDVKELADIVDDANAGSFAYSAGWLAARSFAEAIRECGPDCTPSEINETLQDLGEVDVGEIAYGPYGFTTDDHEGPTSVEYFHSDGGEITGSGEAIDIDE